MSAAATAPTPHADQGPAVEVHHLVKRFGEMAAVDDLDLSIRRGELFGILGPNGAGKTTLLRMLIGLIPITSGQATVAGVDVRRDPDGVRRALGVVPQALTSDLDLTGLENMDIYARFFGLGRERHARIEYLLRQVGLWDRRGDLVRTYSGGMRRRLEIARGLVHRPQILVLDEPTIGLDPQSRHVIWDLLRELRSGDQLTVLLTTHYLDEAEVLCDRVAIVDHGKIVALGTTAELKAKVPDSDTVELGVAGGVSDAELDQLRAMKGVHQVERTPDGVRVRGRSGAELLPALIDAFRGHGRSIASAALHQLSLEDVFIHVTGGSLREEAGHVNPQSWLPRRFT